MKTDFYTKTVLTVIAVCLSIIVLKQVDIIPSAYADLPKTSLGKDVKYGLVPLNADGSINVNVVDINSSETLEVDIRRVDGSSISGKIPVSIAGVSTSDELDVNIDEVGGSFIQNSIPVTHK